MSVADARAFHALFSPCFIQLNFVGIGTAKRKDRAARLQGFAALEHADFWVAHRSCRSRHDLRTTYVSLSTSMYKRPSRLMKPHFQGSACHIEVGLTVIHGYARRMTRQAVECEKASTQNLTHLQLGLSRDTADDLIDHQHRLSMTSHSKPGLGISAVEYRSRFDLALSSASGYMRWLNLLRG